MEVTQSPCKAICVMDAATGLCVGCGRTLTEIAGWAAMTAQERARIMAVLPGRLARAAFPPLDKPPRTGRRRLRERRGDT